AYGAGFLGLGIGAGAAVGLVAGWPAGAVVTV
ncbi:MAG: hypothetical protein QOE92_642, partial [Chloroflexota bacterium]|nr:hypothetical protein [Chloroflexota bacterium]